MISSLIPASCPCIALRSLSSAGNDELYEAQRGNYTDPLKELENIAKKQKDVGLYEESIYSMRRRYEEMSLSVEQLLKEEEIDEEKLAEINMEQQLLLDRIGEMERKLDKERKAIQGQLAGIKEDINNCQNPSSGTVWHQFFSKTSTSL